MVGIKKQQILNVLIRFSVISLFSTLAVFSNPGWSQSNDAPGLSLAQLEQQLTNGVNANLADMQIQQRLKELNITNAQSGLEIYGGTHYANNHRSNPSDDKDTMLNSEIGLRYPLFGNRSEQRIDQITAKYSSDIANLKRQAQSRTSLRDLHKQYIQYWENHSSMDLARSYLLDKLQVSDRLKKRMDQGLLLQADELEFSSSFDKASMDLSMYDQYTDQALHRIGFLAGQDIQTAAPIRPDFSHACTVERILKVAARQSSPEIRLLELEQRKHLDSQNVSKWAPIKASAYAGLRFDNEFGREDGDRWGAGINFTLPVNLKAAMNGHQAKALVAVQNAALELQKHNLELTSEITAAVDRFRTAGHGVKFAVKRIMTTREAVREAWLRFQTLDGDVMESLQSTRYQYYRAALDGIAAQAKYFKAEAHLVHYLPEGCNSEPKAGLSDAIVQVQEDLSTPLISMSIDQSVYTGTRIADIKASIDRDILGDTDFASVKLNIDQSVLTSNNFVSVKMSTGQGTFPGSEFAGVNLKIASMITASPRLNPQDKSNALYIWASREFFSVINKNPQYLGKLLDSGIHRLWISLDRAQINSAIAEPEELRTQIEFIHKRGMQVELLLGEPSWMTPAGRGDLLSIINDLSTLPFDGLHLDLEPEQLAHYTSEPERALQQLVDTLNDVNLVSPWPISFSTHYRNLSNQTVCLACAVRKLGIENISLMIYASNPRRVVEIGKPIIDAHPDINISIAQSIEPSLSRDESLWHRSSERAQESILQISNEIGTDNFSGIAIQSWSHYYQHSES